jgi:hypothetical protein
MGMIGAFASVSFLNDFWFRARSEAAHTGATGALTPKTTALINRNRGFDHLGLSVHVMEAAENASSSDLAFTVSCCDGKKEAMEFHVLASKAETEGGAWTLHCDCGFHEMTGLGCAHVTAAFSSKSFVRPSGEQPRLPLDGRSVSDEFTLARWKSQFPTDKVPPSPCRTTVPEISTELTPGCMWVTGSSSTPRGQDQPTRADILALQVNHSKAHQ